jgi:hypothetical protein
LSFINIILVLKLNNRFIKGSKTDLDYDDIAKLKYIGCVFNESLRLWPPAPDVFRVTTEQTCIAGVNIPANTTLIVNIKNKQLNVIMCLLRNSLKLYYVFILDFAIFLWSQS